VKQRFLFVVIFLFAASSGCFSFRTISATLPNVNANISGRKSFRPNEHSVQLKKIKSAKILAPSVVAPCPAIYRSPQKDSTLKTNIFLAASTP
jgi:hypothetical protein